MEELQQRSRVEKMVLKRKHWDNLFILRQQLRKERDYMEEKFGNLMRDDTDKSTEEHNEAETRPDCSTKLQKDKRLKKLK